MDKLSYALGLSMGNNFKGSGIQDLNVDDFAAAVRSVYDGSKPEMTIDEAKQVVTEFFTELEKRQVEMNREVGKRFLEENAKKEGKSPLQACNIKSSRKETESILQPTTRLLCTTPVALSTVQCSTARLNAVHQPLSV